MNQSIADFVHEALLRGVSRERIALGLREGGWTQKEITAALEAFVETGLPLPVPRKRVSSSPKEAFLFLMLFSTLYTAAFQFGSILFNLIDLWLPQPGETAYASIVSLRYGIASTIVALPIFLFMSRIIARESARNPGQRIAPVRRWLTYLTLFVASTALVVDVIAMILRFLEGDVTARFGLKVVAVAVLAGGAFAYYLRDLRRDEVAPSSESRLTPAARLALTALLGSVVVVLGMAFWFAGSPMKARMLAQDRQRVQDLAAISRQVERYYSNKGQLPGSLSECDINPGTFVEHKADRITRRPYEYRVIDPKHFELAAVFELASVSGSSDTRSRGPSRVPPEFDGFWSHAPGRHTFTIEVGEVPTETQ